MRVRMKLKPFIALVALVTLASMIGCATSSFVDDTAAGLAVSKTTYDSTMSVAANLHKQGILTDAEKANFIKYGNAYMKVHNSLTDALADYAEAEDMPGITEEELAAKKAAITALYVSLGVRLADLMNYFYQVEESNE